MTRTEIGRYRDRLCSVASRLRDEVARLRDEATAPLMGDSSLPFETADLAVHEAEESRTQAVLTNEQSILEEVDAAIDRIEAGAFGKCEGCGHALGHERLEAIPYARWCVGCAGARELAQ